MIEFGVYAPDEETFWQSWQSAGIVDEDRRFKPEYFNGVQTTAGAWSGQIEGVNGWHCNVRVYGPLAAEMTYGLPQTDANGNLLDIFDRTWAAEVFQLTEQPADPTTGFPAGYRNSNGVTYADSRNFSSPANVWA